MKVSMLQDFEAGMRKVKAVASEVCLMSQLHIVHISLFFLCLRVNVMMVVVMGREEMDV